MSEPYFMAIHPLVVKISHFKNHKCQPHSGERGKNQGITEVSTRQVHGLHQVDVEIFYSK